MLSLLVLDFYFPIEEGLSNQGSQLDFVSPNIYNV